MQSRVLYKMRKVLITTLVAFVCLASLIVFTALRAKKYSAQASAFANEAFSAVALNWSLVELLKLSTPNLLTDKTDLLLIDYKNRFGAFKSIEQFDCNAFMSLSTAEGAKKTANCKASAVFEKHPAKVSLQLLYNESVWKIHSFEVNVDYSKPNN